jgi:hypothetical protein
MLEKLTMHDIKDVTEHFSLADKCTRVVEGRAWHTSPAPEVGKDIKPNAGVIAQGSDNNNNKKKKNAGGNNQPLTGAPTAVTAVVGGGRGPRDDKRLRQASSNHDGGARYPVHNSTLHSASECREIKKFVK